MSRPVAEIKAEALLEAAAELDAEPDSEDPRGFGWARDQEAVRIIRWLRERAAALAHPSTDPDG